MTPEASGRTGHAPSRRTLALVLVVAATLLGATVVTVVLTRDDAPERASTGDGVVLDNAGPDGQRAPTEPKARICGSPGLLGPASPPDGYRVVSPGQRLDTLVEAAPPGTRFYLRTGVHTLGGGQYDQVTPKSGMVFLGAPGAVLDGQQRNVYAFTGHATGVRIEHLTIRNFGTERDTFNEGVVNHDAGDGWQIRHNTVRDNGGAGVFVGDGNVLADNCLSHNGQYGFSAYETDGVQDVVLEHNEIVGNNTADWEATYEDCGCTGGGKFWETTNADITGNWIHDNHGPGIWADTNNTRFLVSQNYFSDNDGEGMVYETSYNADISFNTFRRNAIVNGRTTEGFPTAALYISESGSDPRAGKEYGAAFRIVGNVFVDNWGGVTAWENADRFAGSPANTSSGTTTLVNPGVATEASCGKARLVGTDPYHDDCRWKTQNLLVQGNTFAFTPAHLGPGCTPARGCGWNALASNWGSYPDWSPYQGDQVEKAITFHQGNRWSDNSYRGPWHFMAGELWNRVSWQEWRAAPYGQDAGSTLVP